MRLRLLRLRLPLLLLGLRRFGRRISHLDFDICVVGAEVIVPLRNRVIGSKGVIVLGDDGVRQVLRLNYAVVSKLGFV